MKFDPRTMYEIGIVEQRKNKEVWENSPKGVKIINPAFDVIPKELITGFITEFGTFAPAIVYDKIKEKYSWMF